MKPLNAMALTKLIFPDQGAMISSLLGISQEKDGVPHEDLDDALRAINRRFDRAPLKELVLDLYTNRRLLVLGNKSTVAVPASLPAWLISSPRGAVAAVNATPYMPAGGVARVDIRRLYGLLAWGSVLVAAHDRWEPVTSSQALLLQSATLYASAMLKVADRLTGVGMDRMAADQFRYLAAKCLLVSMAGRAPGEQTDAIAAQATGGKTSTSLLGVLESSVGEALKAPSQQELYGKSPIEIYGALRDTMKWFAKSSSRSFVQTFSSMYGIASLFMMESFPHFLGGVVSHQVGSELISSVSFDAPYSGGTAGDAVVGELVRLLRKA